MLHEEIRKILTKTKKQESVINENRSAGLGDTVEKIADATGVKKVVDNIYSTIGKDCGCNKRKQLLNKLMPYKQGN
jgi:hypothetical protein